MAYELNPEQPIRDETIRIAREQIDKSIKALDRAEKDADTAVHDVRRHCKLIRALVRAVRPSFPGYPTENSEFRDLARTLSTTRDAAAALESFDALTRHFDDLIHPKAFAALRRELDERRQALAATQDLPVLLEDARRRLYLAYWRAGKWKIEHQGFGALHDGLCKTYGRGRRRMAAVAREPTTEALHDWRKRAKYHRYHLRLLGSTWPALFSTLEQETHRLTNYLGDDHDLAVLQQILLAEPERFGHPKILRPLMGLIRWRRSELQKAALPLGQRLFAQAPAARTSYFRKLWEARLRESKPRQVTKSAGLERETSIPIELQRIV